jgi:hypothetical protein
VDRSGLLMMMINEYGPKGKFPGLKTFDLKIKNEKEIVLSVMTRMSQK